MFDFSTYENATTEKWKIKIINDIEIPIEKEELLELVNIANTNDYLMLISKTTIKTLKV